MVKPLNHLRKQVRARASSASLSTRPVDVPGHDGVGDLARVFNTLLEAIEAQRQAETIAQDERYAQVRFEGEAPELLPMQAARLSLEDALRNLIDNAASLALMGGGHVWITLEADKTQARFVVRDDGPGIVAEDLPRIFDRFFTRRADDRGTGLGLAMTRAIVRAHQGQLEVSAAPGQGATFTITMPREATLREPNGRPA